MPPRKKTDQVVWPEPAEVPDDGEPSERWARELWAREHFTSQEHQDAERQGDAS